MDNKTKPMMTDDQFIAALDDELYDKVGSILDETEPLAPLTRKEAMDRLSLISAQLININEITGEYKLAIRRQPQSEPLSLLYRGANRARDILMKEVALLRLFLTASQTEDQIKKTAAKDEIVVREGMNPSDHVLIAESRKAYVKGMWEAYLYGEMAFEKLEQSGVDIGDMARSFIGKGKGCVSDAYRKAWRAERDENGRRLGVNFQKKAPVTDRQTGATDNAINGIVVNTVDTKEEPQQQLVKLPPKSKRFPTSKNVETWRQNR